jgi:hypothetical protein
MASRLGWKIQTSKLRAGVEIALQIVSQHGAFRLTIDRMPDGPSDLRRVHFACKIDDQPGALDFTADGDARISVETIGTSAATRSVAFQATRIAEIVGRQWTDREPDPVFREAMASAQVLAQAVLR